METKQNEKSLAMRQKNVADQITDMVQQRVAANQLHLPADYSAENALKAAWLILQDAVNKDKQPVLQSCEPNSIGQALFNMVVLGLNPVKKQCYFLPYGRKLSCQPSYFGNMAMAKRLNKNVADFVYEAVYKGDNLKMNVIRGQRVVVEHEQTLDSITGGEIVAAYCMALDKEGKAIRSEVMTIKEIHQSWRQSKQNPFLTDGSIKPDSVHGKFPRDMCIRTVVNRVAKPLINTSDDSYLRRALNQSSEVEAEEDFAAEVAAKANTGEIIDTDGTIVDAEWDESSDPGVDMETGELKEGGDQQNQPDF